MYWSKLNPRITFSPCFSISIYRYGNLKWKLQSRPAVYGIATLALCSRMEEAAFHSHLMTSCGENPADGKCCKVCEDGHECGLQGWTNSLIWKENATEPAPDLHFPGAKPALLTGRPPCLSRFKDWETLIIPDFSPFHRMQLSRSTYRAGFPRWLWKKKEVATSRRQHVPGSQT